MRDQISHLARERSEDLMRLGELMKQTANQTVTDVMNEVASRCSELDQKIHTSAENISGMIKHEVEDKVRVDEVQDALRRLSESISTKCEVVR